MKKYSILFILILFSLLSVNAIENTQTDNTLIYTPEATNNNEEGILEYVNTIQGYGYTAITKLSSYNHYWSQLNGFDEILNSYIAREDGSRQGYRNFGNINEDNVILLENIYLPRGSIVKFELVGNSCAHVGSSARIYMNGEEIGILIVPTSVSASPAEKVSFYYVVHQSDYYTFSAIGTVPQCTTSLGHGIFIDSEYEIYKYKYLISYNLSGGILLEENPTYYYEEDEDIILNNPIKEGHTFLGWTNEESNIPIETAIISSEEYGNKNFQANFKINQYSVTYIDVIKDINGIELGRTEKLVDYQTNVCGSDLGNNTAENAYYNGYYYVSDTSAVVTTDGATVYRFFNSYNIEKSVAILWNDNENEDNLRPETYQVTLLQNGKPYKTENVSSDIINYSFENLPQYDKEGNSYTYEIQLEIDSERYEKIHEQNTIILNYQKSNFSVIIPKEIILDGETGKGDYAIFVNGIFYSNDTLIVKPESDLTLTDRNNISSMEADILQVKTTFSKENMDLIADGTIQTKKQLFAGSWSGHFNFNIKFIRKD